MTNARRPRPAAAGLLALAAAALAPGAAAQVTLGQSFDSGALDVAGSSVDLSVPSIPIVTLEPRRLPGEWPGDHWWVHFRVEGVAGTAARFRVPTAGAFQAYTTSHRWVYSATPDLPESWQHFDDGRIIGPYFVSANEAPFVDDVIHVAWHVPYPFGRTIEHTASLLGNPLVEPTPSANAAFVLGQTPGTAAGGYVDDLGRAVPAFPLLGYRIASPGAGPKARVVVMTGNHSGEPTGSWTFQGFVDFLLGSDPDAVELRSLADVYVYPQCDPEGRFAGYFRSNPENPTLNHNRSWEDASGFTDVTIVTDAMVADTGGDVDVFLDFHGFGSPTDVGFLAPTSNAATRVLLDELSALDPSIQDFTIPNPQPGATAARWAADASGLCAEVSITSEAGSLAGEGVDRFVELGETWARATLAAVRDAPRARRPGSAGVFRGRALGGAPALYLPLDETGGTQAADASGNGRHGTYVGGVALGVEDGFLQGNRSAAKFSGTSGAPGGERVRVGDFPYAGAGNELTLAFRFATEDVAGSGTQYLFSHGDPVERESLNVWLEEQPAVGTGNRLRTVFLDADDPESFANVLDVAPAPADGAWHLYTLVVSSSEGAVLYLDGYEVQRRPAAGGDAFDPAGDLFLAIRSDLDPATAYGGAPAQDGRLDEVLLFDRALDASEVLALAEARVRFQLDVTPIRTPAAGGSAPVGGPSGGGFDLRVLRDGEPAFGLVVVGPAGELDLAARGAWLLVPPWGRRLALPAALAGTPLVLQAFGVGGARSEPRRIGPRPVRTGSR